MRKLLLFFLLLMSQIWVNPDSLLANTPLANHIVADTVVSGTVYDTDGKTILPGVNVRVKGTTNGTATDANGKYQIAVPNVNSVLVFSFVGYVAREITVEDRTQINVTLAANSSALDEVVVVGYGTRKKVNLTGSVSSVTIDEKVSDRSVTNLSTALSGMVPGLSVQQSTSLAGSSQAKLLVRGLSSPTSNTDPLIVVDGIPDVDINRININDVENISVLKDAAAAAVYGSRAATGVILITTKSGKGLKKPKISYTATFATDKPTNFYNFLTDYPMALTLEQRASRNGRTQPNFYDGTIDEWLAQGMVDPIRFPEVNQLDYVTHNGKLAQHNISAAGANDNGNYFVSVGIYDENGYLINNDAKRYNFRTNFDYNINKSITVGARLDGQWTNQKFGLPDGFLDYSNGNAPLTVAISGLLPYNYETNQYGGAMAYGEASNADNLYGEINARHNLVQRQEFNGDIYGAWSPIKGLTARVDYSLRYYNQFQKSYTDLGVDLYNFQTGGTVFNLFPSTTNLSNASGQGYKTLAQARIDYTKEIFKGHQLSLLAVATEEYWLDRGFSVGAGGRLDQSITELGNQALAPLNVGFSGNSTDEGLRSYVGRLNYTINDKYLFEASIRADGSSKFSPGHQWGYFPSVSAGWRFSEEKFFEPLKNVVSSGKLRVSYGSLGNNRGVNRYDQLQTLVSTPYVLNGNTLVSGVSANKQLNEDFTWESTRVANVGLDLGFFNNKLTAEIDVYDRLTTNLIRPSVLSTLLTGYVPPNVNIGTFRNDGLELNLTWRSNINKFNYGATFNFSYNIDRLEKWSQHLNPSKNFLEMPWFFAYYLTSSGIAQTWQDIYDAPYQGNANIAPGDLLYKDLNGDGQIGSFDKKAVPTTNEQRPTCNYGANLFASWNNFDMSVLLQATTGRKDYFLENQTSTNIAPQRYNFQTLYLDQTWSLEHRNALYPRLEAANAANNRPESDFWLESMDYLRFKNIQLGYTVPTKLLKKLGVDRIRIYATAENLFTITSWRGIDPEKSTLGNGFSNYADDPIPIMKSYSFGVNVGF
ncbi:SusC/RagA family TonB-linked outer membrane protein [Mucilaginibacter segetis]|uniref:TonB-dependent receptor n=1 Tax=Mucilaginibacter segetis TaxID=2793071 RepID=A0A934UN56_9SPHI|nr:TonB-dependent receptor [Mucilaginibacter segetis]MBK0379705.1 TonB-dependent receptor [Mucilaginibacter segetis]